MEYIKPKLVLVNCNPVLPPDLTIAVSPEQPGHESGLVWGASKGAFQQLAVSRGYSLQAISADGLFLLFAHGVEQASFLEERNFLPKVESVPARTVYGQTLQISTRNALKILAGANLINTTNGQPIDLSPDGETANKTV